MHTQNWFDWATGYKLGRLRKKEGRTLREAAEAIGVTPQFISSVEKGRSGISLANLDALLRYYHSSLSETFPKGTGDIFIHLEDAEPFDINNDKIYSAFLFPRKDGVAPDIEALYHRLEPGAKSKTSRHAGAEFFFILEGTLDCTLEDPDTGEQRTYHMTKGDSLHIAPWTPHFEECPGPDPAEALAISPGRGEFTYTRLKDSADKNAE